jgi:hypothetical protein
LASASTWSPFLWYGHGVWLLVGVYCFTFLKCIYQNYIKTRNENVCKNATVRLIHYTNIALEIFWGHILDRLAGVDPASVLM